LAEEAHKQEVSMLQEQRDSLKQEAAENNEKFTARIGVEVGLRIEAHQNVNALTQQVEKHVNEQNALHTLLQSEQQRKVEMCRRVILRMQKSDLVNAFDLFSDAVSRHKVHRDMMLELLHTLLYEGNLKAIGMCGRLLQAGPNSMPQYERYQPQYERYQLTLPFIDSLMEKI
jgi:hypothetical protein